MRIIHMLQDYPESKTTGKMNLYSLAVFLHVTGAIMLGFITGLEWIMILRLRRVVTREEALTAIGHTKIIGKMSPVTWLSILIPGFYMVFVRWGWAPWINTAIAGWLILLISGALIAGKKLTALMKELEAGDAPGPGLKSQMRSMALLKGLQLRTSVTLAIIFMMTVKPSLVISVMALFISFACVLIPVGTGKKAGVTQAS